MKLEKLRFFSILFVLLLYQSNSIAQEIKEKPVQEFELEIEGEYRYFYDDPQFENQESHSHSLAFTPEYSITSKDG